MEASSASESSGAQEPGPERGVSRSGQEIAPTFLWQEAGWLCIRTGIMWHYTIGSVSRGPFTVEQMVHEISTGQIQRLTLVWREGMPEWIPADRSELAAYFRQPPGMPLPVPGANPYAAPASMGYQQVPTPHRQLTWMQILFSFEGRILRWQWWVTFVIQISVLIFGIGIPAALADESGQDLAPAMVVVAIAVFFLFAWIRFASTAKRWHDRGKSGWMSCVYFIPIVGPIWTLVECGFMEGTPGTNFYGTDPAGRGRGHY